jgi:hypothetical protein
VWQCTDAGPVHTDLLEVGAEGVGAPIVGAIQYGSAESGDHLQRLLYVEINCVSVPPESVNYGVSADAG